MSIFARWRSSTSTPTRWSRWRWSTAIRATTASIADAERASFADLAASPDALPFHRRPSGERVGLRGVDPDAKSETVHGIYPTLIAEPAGRRSGLPHRRRVLRHRIAARLPRHGDHDREARRPAARSRPRLRRSPATRRSPTPSSGIGHGRRRRAADRMRRRRRCEWCLRGAEFSRRSLVMRDNEMVATPF